MKAMLILLGVLAVASAWAQDSPEPFCYVARDYSCNGSTSGESTNFATDADGAAVTFRCTVVCSQGADPSNCRLRAKLMQGNTVLASCDNWNGEDCNDPTIISDQTIVLQPNTQYTLVAILEGCGEGCCGNCHAVAMAWEKNAECPAP